MIPKESVYPNFIFYALLLCLLLVTAAKIVRPAVFTSLSTAVFNNNSLLQSMKDGFSPFNSGGIFLLLNYFVVVVASTFLIADYYTLSFHLLYVPLGYFFFLLFSFLFVGALIGKLRVFSESVQNLFFFHQLIGLVLLPLLIIWMLNLEFTPVFFRIFLVLFAIIQVYRWFRGGVFALYHRVKWYYFILYFCTLEIIPIFLVIRLLN
ncbi:MAG: DUF4271 domain-containing protein [Lishizhenia sp.]